MCFPPLTFHDPMQTLSFSFCAYSNHLFVSSLRSGYGPEKREREREERERDKVKKNKKWHLLNKSLGANKVLVFIPMLPTYPFNNNKSIASCFPLSMKLLTIVRCTERALLRNFATCRKYNRPHPLVTSGRELLL